MIRFTLIYSLLFIGVLLNDAYAFEQSDQFSDIQTINIDSDELGYLRNTSNDGFIVLN